MTLLLVLLAVAADDAAGQRRIISLEVNPIHATLGYGWALAPDRYAGVEAGFGFPQLDRTLTPDDGDDLTDFLHVGAFLRAEPNRNFALDARARVGLAELHGCSGCFPGLFGSVSGGAFVGLRRVKVGSRLTAGLIREDVDGTNFVLNLTPFALLFSHAW